MGDSQRNEALKAFEAGLDPRHIERSDIPARVLGYGEISTVFAIDAIDSAVAFKRMPMFHSVAEAQAYVALYERAMAVLGDEIGLDVASAEMVRVGSDADAYVTLYMLQEKLPADAIVTNALAFLSPEETDRLISAVVAEIDRVFAFNRADGSALALGFDAQLSNWAIRDFDSAEGLADDIKLVYFDTTTPLMQENGVEQLNPELFLRSAPSFLRWLLRLLFVEDVVTRYYDQRKVLIDLAANLYKEQRPDLVPRVVEIANASLAQSGQEAITLKAVESYYREDAFIWRLYLRLRRWDQRLHAGLGREYPYILPGPIAR